MSVHFRESTELAERWSSIVDITPSYGLNSPGFEFQLEQEILFSQKSLVRLWGPPSLLFNKYCAVTWKHSGWGMKLTTHLHLVPRLRITGAILVLHPSCAFIACTGTALPLVPFT